MKSSDIAELLKKDVVNIEGVLDFIKTCNNEEYVKISQAMQVRRDIKIANAKLNFKVGCKVKITSKPELGVFQIIKTKVKNAHVRSCDNPKLEYNVTMSLLELV